MRSKKAGIKQAKQVLRKVMLVRLLNQKEEERSRKSRIIARRLFSLKAVKQAKTLMFFVSIDKEVKTDLMISRALKQGKTVVVPGIYKKSRAMDIQRINCLQDISEKGPFNIPQPAFVRQHAVKPERIDCVIVPGLAFDLKGSRLGRGKGYYDRFLKRLPAGSVSIGVCFDFQIVPSVPSRRQDQVLARIVKA